MAMSQMEGRGTWHNRLPRRTSRTSQPRRVSSTPRDSTLSKYARINGSKPTKKDVVN